MNPAPCPCEERVAAAVRSGVWSDSLRAHAADCPCCGETMLVAGMLLATAREDAPQEVPPSAGLVWWKAQLRLRREARERIERPMRIFDHIAAAAGLATTAWGAAWFADAPPLLLLTAGIGFALLLAAGASAYFIAARTR